MMSDLVLVIDIGTTSVRVAAVDPAGKIREQLRRKLPPSSPAPGLVEFDALELATTIEELANRCVASCGPVAAVGITNQRASTVAWSAYTHQPLMPALGWQDLRTVFDCIMAKANHGLALAPNQSATKMTWLLANIDPQIDRADIRFGTVDSWITWWLSNGHSHVTDTTNAAVTGLTSVATLDWNADTLTTLGIDRLHLPRIVPSSGELANASRITGAPPITALIGDQQGSLVGQGCIAPGEAKITFGTGGMLDVITGAVAPRGASRSESGTFPIVARTSTTETIWGAEAIMLAAGTNVEWLVDDMGLIASAEESEAVAASVDSSDGVVYVPALLGLGTPYWDYGARGTLLGITRGTTRAHIVRAVLEGVAARGADLVEATREETGLPIATIRIDGGMSRNGIFTKALADATQATIEVAADTESTTLGAAYLAGTQVGIWPDLASACATREIGKVVEPGSPTDRGGWRKSVQRAAGWIPDLSALDF
jgi:glycerol kinase